MSKPNFSYRTYFEREIQIRTVRNPGYSLRAFARDIGLAAPKLSQILSGTCGLSKTSALKVAKKLKLNEAETEYFVALVEVEHNRSKRGKIQAQQRLATIESSSINELDLERFRIIADWYHFSLLELTEVQGFQSDIPWIAKRLGISQQEAAADRAIPCRGFRSRCFERRKLSKDTLQVPTRSSAHGASAYAKA